MKDFYSYQNRNVKTFGLGPGFLVKMAASGTLPASDVLMATATTHRLKNAGV